MKEGQEMELVNMIIECCIQERTYLRFYGLLAERLCVLFNIFKQNFQIQFENQYIKVHRFETNKLRNLAKLFAHLLHTNAIEWSVLKLIKLTEELREAIKENRLLEYREEFIKKYESNNKKND